MRLRDTKLGAWAALCRVQSTPLTLAILMAGYGSVTGDILRQDILKLIVVGSIGHWSVYAMNDHLDMYHDKAQGKSHKPIPSGDITETEASSFIVVSLAATVGLSILWFPMASSGYWVGAVFLGCIYNVRSKRDWFSASYLSAWAVLVAGAGARYAGEPTWATFFIGSAVAVQMFIMTMEGDLKDMGGEEANIAERLHCKVIDGWQSVSFEFSFTFFSMHMAQIVLLIGVSLSVSGSIIHVTFITLAGGWSMFIIDSMLRHQPYSPDRLKREIVYYTISSVLALGMAVEPVIGAVGALVMGVGSVLWGVTMQTILYGEPLFFP